MYGSETEVTDLDDQGSTLKVIKKVRGGEVASVTKIICRRIKVQDMKGETTEYLKHSDKVRSMLADGTLVIDVKIPETIPCFMTEFPKGDIDGSYFVISRWAELVRG